MIKSVYWEWLLDLDHLVRYCLGQLPHPPRRVPDLEERLRCHG
jgi:hypothetical protein